ncbi:hypothetical protein RIF29_02553 [Crotalaria pallida]|uniref:Uncharacterized protein n=1 Tax=Crotalaria pallida TaxID=3830 RepID=A0AAN9P981_CROPI
MGQRWATPRQACPQPNGFGRNLRSKTRWFTGFCNSHQVSHFATFFIDAGAEISVAESLSDTRVASPPARAPSPSRRGRTKRFRFPWRIRRRVFVIQPGGDRPHKVRRLPTRGGPRSRTPLAIPHTSNKFAGRTACSVDFSQRRRQRTAHVAAIRTLHRTIQSVGATGGVYKGQGRSQRELMTRAY